MNELYLELIATIVAIVYSFVKASDWYKEHVVGSKREKAIDAIIAGVNKTYEEYTKEIKAANNDGKLTKEERAEARRLAKEAAIEFGKKNGVDIVRNIGEDFIDSYLENAVREMKR